MEEKPAFPYQVEHNENKLNKSIFVNYNSGVVSLMAG